jgi:hypothetical protein
LVLILILSGLFFPVIWGKKTLLSSAHGTASILPTGAYVPHPTVWLSPPKTNDPGGVAWFAEPNYALLHDEVFHDHQVALWNPYCGCGVPWLANMQSQVLNPLQALAWLMPVVCRRSVDVSFSAAAAVFRSVHLRRRGVHAERVSNHLHRHA